MPDAQRLRIVFLDQADRVVGDDANPAVCEGGGVVQRPRFAGSSDGTGMNLRREWVFAADSARNLHVTLRERGTIYRIPLIPSHVDDEVRNTFPRWGR